MPVHRKGRRRSAAGKAAAALLKAEKPALDVQEPTKVDIFIHEYLTNGGNAARAYLAIHPGTQYNSARTLAWRLLTKVDVAERIAREKKLRIQRLKIDGDEALALLAINANAPAYLADAYDAKGQLKPIHEWPPELQLASKGIKPGPFGDQIILDSPQRARELLAVAGGKLKNAIDVNVIDLVEYLGAKPPKGDDE